MDKATIIVSGQNGQAVTDSADIGTPFLEVARRFQEYYGEKIILAVEDGKLRELHKLVSRDCSLSFLTLKDKIGHKTYVRSAAMLFFRAVYEVLGARYAREGKLAFTVGPGYYCHFADGFVPDDGQIAAIKAAMRRLAERDLPITKTSYSLEDAMSLFKKYNMTDKEKLFRYRRFATVNIYCLDGYYDYYYGYMAPSTGYVSCFDVLGYESGMLLLLPVEGAPLALPEFNPRKKLFNTLLTTEKWGAKMGISTVGDLNDAACAGQINEMILVQEALQEHRIGDIARDISEHKGTRFVMIAGPSSSGKTTFSHRLSIQLRTYGLLPHPIPLDDYYLDRDQTPRDENGDLNFECLEAIDVELFNSDMKRLLAGERVELPSFNFVTGKREYKGHFKQLEPDDILVIEGIHGLNPKTSYSLPEESKYKIYISCLTGLNIDGHNRIPTTDSRLLRRIVRDSRTRGTVAGQTIKMWSSVRRGEEENIFPYQECADAMFNSALIYELAVLKQYAEPLLFQIGADEPEYIEAKRLLRFLEYLVGVSSEGVPNNSICREFIGGSIFHA